MGEHYEIEKYNQSRVVLGCNTNNESRVLFDICCTEFTMASYDWRAFSVSTCNIVRTSSRLTDVLLLEEAPTACGRCGKVKSDETGCASGMGGNACPLLLEL